MYSPKKWLLQIVALGFLPSDSADLRLKKIALSLVPLIIGPFAFVWGSIYFLLGHYLSGAIPMSYSLVSALSLVYFFRTKEMTFLRNSQLVLVLFLPFLLMWSLGGFAASGMVMLWAIFSPIAALMFLSKRAALLWFLLYFGLILCSVLIDDRVAAWATPMPVAAQQVFYLLNLGCASAGLYLLVSFSMSEEKRATASDLRVAASAFEAQDALMITDARGVILRVNQAFTETTGYDAAEAIGQTPRILKSGRHDAAFYEQMWAALAQTGTWQGEIWDRRKNGEIYPKWLSISAVKNEEGVVTHYVGSHIDITERKTSEEKIQRLAFYDHLTDLPNRLLLLDRLQQALVNSARSTRHGALLFIDLDNFKNLNDTLGHHIGDILLRQVSKRLRTCIREGDTVARLGGDEFVVMLAELSTHAIEAAAQTELVGEKILTALSQTFQIENTRYHCTASIGIVLLNGQQQNPDGVMKQADIAMYQAKKTGRNTLRFFDPEMQTNISARVLLEEELRRALAEGQFELYYQVQVDSALRPLGAEALIRWNHPTHGCVTPVEFIYLAEETGLILPLGYWVLHTACAQLRAWQNNPLTRELTLAVNVSAQEFCQKEFAQQLHTLLQDFAVDPKLLKLELTESVLQKNFADTIAAMNALNELGVEFSLDDFGTGYSSLQYLKQLPLDQLKIDRSFVRDITVDPSDKEIVRTIIAMAQNLKLDVIAEGVETAQQRQQLLESGCFRYQGYLFGKPLPIAQFEASLKAPLMC